MLRQCITIASILFFNVLVFGQTLERCIGQEGFTGYCDAEGNVVIEQKFHDGLDFMEGHALVRVEDKWGIINESGSWMVEPSYDEVFDCENIEDHILVKEDNKWYFCNAYGIKYTRGYEVMSPWYEFDTDGAVARFTEDTWFSVIQKKKWGVVDVNDNIKIPFEYEWIRVLREDNKPMSIVTKKKGKYAWQRLDAEAATGYEFDAFLGTHSDLLFLSADNQTTILNFKTGKRVQEGERDFYTLINDKDSIGLVNSLGKIIVPFTNEFVYLSKIKNHVVYGNYGEFGLNDLDGNLLLEPLYEEIFPLSDNPPTVGVRNQEGLVAIFLLSGEIIQQVTPFRYSYVKFDGNDLRVGLDGKNGTVTLDGKESWQ